MMLICVALQACPLTYTKDGFEMQIGAHHAACSSSSVVSYHSGHAQVEHLQSSQSAMLFLDVSRVIKGICLIDG